MLYWKDPFRIQEAHSILEKIQGDYFPAQSMLALLKLKDDPTNTDVLTCLEKGVKQMDPISLRAMGMLSVMRAASTNDAEKKRAGLDLLKLAAAKGDIFSSLQLAELSSDNREKILR